LRTPKTHHRYEPLLDSTCQGRLGFIINFGLGADRQELRLGYWVGLCEVFVFGYKNTYYKREGLVDLKRGSGPAKRRGALAPMRGEWTGGGIGIVTPILWLGFHKGLRIQGRFLRRGSLSGFLL